MLLTLVELDAFFLDELETIRYLISRGLVAKGVDENVVELVRLLIRHRCNSKDALFHFAAVTPGIDLDSADFRSLLSICYVLLGSGVLLNPAPRSSGRSCFPYS